MSYSTYILKLKVGVKVAIEARQGQTVSVLVSTAVQQYISISGLGIGGPTTPLGAMNMFTKSWLGYECTYYA